MCEKVFKSFFASAFHKANTLQDVDFTNCKYQRKTYLKIPKFLISRTTVLKILVCVLIFAVIPNINLNTENYFNEGPRGIRNNEKPTNSISSNTQEYKYIPHKKLRYCNVNFEDRRKSVTNQQSLQMIYFVTPTYPRPEQYPLLIRLSHTLMHVPRIFWIVADDNIGCSKEVAVVLKRSRLPYIHISSPKPKAKGKNIPFVSALARGAVNRRAALHWVQTFAKDGILYFGDDDNTYDLELFREIRKTKKLSMVPVGLIGNYGISAPLVENGKVIGFLDSWPFSRKFPVDMAGFAVNMKHLKKKMRISSIAGLVEDMFLRTAGFDVTDIEPLASNCTKILAWHTQFIENTQNSSRFNFITNGTMSAIVLWSTQAFLYKKFAGH